MSACTNASRGSYAPSPVAGRYDVVGLCAAIHATCLLVCMVRCTLMAVSFI